MSQNYYWSPSRAAFYPVALSALYLAAKSRPDDAALVDDSYFKEFGSISAPAGQRRGADASGMPCWLTNSSAYTLTGADTGTVGAAIELSIVANNSGPAFDTPITFSDAGAGGTFTPSSTVIPAGSVASQQVQYIPAKSGTVFVSSANKCGIEDPSALSVTVT